MKVAAIIPARKGSKRIPKKNHHSIDGDYLINKVIRNLENSKYISDIYITTDDLDLQNLITSNQVKFLSRKSEFCDDFATVVDLVKSHFHEDLISYDAIFQIYIHAASIDSATIDNAIERLFESKKSFLISMTKMNVPVEWTFKRRNKDLIPNFPGTQNIRSQDLGDSFIDAGQFYAYKAEWFLENQKNDYENSAYLEIKDYQSVDLDNPEDLETLEYSYKYAKTKIQGLS